MSEKYERTSLIRNHYDEIAHLAEKHLSWLRVAEIFRLSGLARNHADLGRKLADFAAITKTEAPSESILNFIRKWTERPLDEVFGRTADIVMVEFYKNHPNL
ncbi:hypothetical protein M2323_000328 [Rhodoblastus acidophilus]|uniref:hypothetical protein n=1 Tax=Rhodoblastus acidophilus TaxID=1074 RepID=UPI0022253730|nr:hypothetical protein [Rhodoblastus acidophilus]MCW2282567.1 hypothetical protein [Rhodoblastus acidophilus]MCW2331428.1 hypothetical protein [Rhodoblastus acidophilus]